MYHLLSPLCDLAPLPVFSVSVNGITNHPCQTWELPEHLPVLYRTNPIWHHALSLLPAKHLPHPSTAVVFIQACVTSYCHGTGCPVPPYNLLPQSEAHVIFLNKNPGVLALCLKSFAPHSHWNKSHISVCGTQTPSPTCLSVQPHLLSSLRPSSSCFQRPPFMPSF